jgi:hypothetical protein
MKAIQQMTGALFGFKKLCAVASGRRNSGAEAVGLNFTTAGRAAVSGGDEGAGSYATEVKTASADQ